MPAYKLIFIVGPDHNKAFPVDELKMIVAKYPREACMIGDGKRWITFEEIEQTLSKHTDSNTRIGIYAHGLLKFGTHTMNLVDECDWTSEILSIICSCVDSTVIVDLHSCYAGSAADTVRDLRSGSMLICHSPMNDVSRGIPADNNLERSLKHDIKPLDLILLAFTSEVCRSISSYRCNFLKNWMPAYASMTAVGRQFPLSLRAFMDIEVSKISFRRLFSDIPHIDTRN